MESRLHLLFVHLPLKKLDAEAKPETKSMQGS